MKRPCIVCGKPCSQSDRNADGTYAHLECLRAYDTRMVKGEKT